MYVRMYRYVCAYLMLITIFECLSTACVLYIYILCLYTYMHMMPMSIDLYVWVPQRAPVGVCLHMCWSVYMEHARVTVHMSFPDVLNSSVYVCAWVCMLE